MTESNDLESPSLDVYDHVRPTGDVLDDGVYRVVGTSPDGVTLLRVADADGRRVHSGRIVSIAASDLASLEPAANPDENRSVGAAVVGRLDGLWWSLRLLGRTVVERPLPSTVALALLAVGLFGDRFVQIPDIGDAVLAAVGAFSLVYLSRH